jgi:hypothetical protein
MEAIMTCRERLEFNVARHPRSMIVERFAPLAAQNAPR